MHARRPGTEAPRPRGTAALPWLSSSWSSSSAGWYLRREQSTRDLMAEDREDSNNSKALSRSLSRTTRLGRDPCPPRQLRGFIIQPKMESMEGVWFWAGCLGRNDPPPLLSSHPPSAVVASWVDDNNNYDATTMACPPSLLPLPHAAAVLEGQLAPSWGPPLILSSQFGW